MYDDALNDTSNWSWATHQLASTSPVQSGSRAIAVNTVAWTGMQLHLNSPFVVTAGSRFEFWINGEAGGGQALDLQLNADGAYAASLPVTSLIGGPVPANQWRLVSWDLGAAGLTGRSITEIIIFATANAGRYSIDNVRFVR